MLLGWRVRPIEGIERRHVVPFRLVGMEMGRMVRLLRGEGLLVRRVWERQ
jgi:hypothetical protein